MAFKAKATSGILSKRYLWLAADDGQGTRFWRYVTDDDASTIAASGYITDQEYLDLMRVGDWLLSTEVGSISDSREVDQDEAVGGFVAASLHKVDSNDGTTLDLTGDLLGGSIADGSIAIAKLVSATAGDLLYWDVSGDPALLPIGSPGEVLEVSGGLPAWGSVAGTGTMTTVKEAGVQVGDADIVTLDFDGDDFNLTESPDTEINVAINKSGSDTTIISGTAAASGNYATWNADGDLVDGGAPTGIDGTPVTGTAAAAGNYATWNSDGDLVDGGAPTGVDGTPVTGTAGTSGNLVQWNADGDAVDAGVATADVLAATTETAQTPSAVTVVDFTSIPSGTRHITVMVSALSTDGTDDLLLQLGDSGGIENTGYVSQSSSLSDGNSQSDGSTAGFLTDVNAATDEFYGQYILNKVTGNEWVCTWTLRGSTSNVNAVASGAGGKTLSAELDRVRLTTTGGTNNFDAGTVNIVYW